MDNPTPTPQEQSEELRAQIVLSLGWLMFSAGKAGRDLGDVVADIEAYILGIIGEDEDESPYETNAKAPTVHIPKLTTRTNIYRKGRNKLRAEQRTALTGREEK